ncbi:MAG: RND family transporter, partial [Gammaproteobacteria bacterium]|nr:RND family transporter [Gammaproteobacteria bacterium]
MAIGSIVRFPVLILTMLICLPLLMSYTGVSKRSIALMKDEEEGHSHPFWRTLTVFTTRRGASVLLIIVLIFAVSGYAYRQDLKIGDLDPGAPELRPDSRYNLDNGFMVENYTATNDLFVIMVETETEANSNYDMLSNMLILQTELEGLEGVQSTESMVDDIQLLSAAYNEGNFKWSALPRSQSALDNLSTKVSTAKANQSGSLSLVRVFLDDHKATTLNRVVALVEKFAAENNTEEFRFIMGAGPAGIEAATNIEIESAQVKMMLLVYGVVGFLVFLTFRSLRAMIAIMVPLALTSLLCEVLMTYLGIGVKVATLPVISIG